jgi:hypothetical protein
MRWSQRLVAPRFSFEVMKQALLSVISVASYAREIFEQIWTRELRNRARKRQSGDFVPSQITTVLPRICSRITQ